MNLQSILRVYRAAPHSSTGQTPFQLISKAPVPRLFTQLQVSQQKTQETNRSSVPKNKIRSVRTFSPGDHVLVYDTQTKLNSKGTVKDCKSSNSYIVEINNCNKHILSDHMSLVSKNNDNVNISIKQIIYAKDSDNIVINNNEDLHISDNISIHSDFDDDDIFIPSNLHYVDDNFANNDNILQPNQLVRRNTRSESQRLNDGLSMNPPGSRLRSGK